MLFPKSKETIRRLKVCESILVVEVCPDREQDMVRTVVLLLLHDVFVKTERFLISVVSLE